MSEKLLYQQVVRDALRAEVEFFNVNTGRWNKGRVVALCMSMVWITNRKRQCVKIQREWVRMV